MKKNVYISTIIVSFVLMGFAKKETHLLNNLDLIGTWEYFVPDTAYEYQEGLIIFEYVDGKLSGYIMVGENKTDIEDIIVKDKNVTFNLFLEGEEISLKLEFKDNTFSGVVSYSEGELDISGKRKTKE